MAEKTYPMTLAEKEKLEQELEELKLVRRPEVVERIKIARSYGDLSENSEYEAAKDEQAFVEGQISSLEPLQFKKLAKQMKKYTASLVQQGQMPLQERSLTKAQSVTL